MNGKKIIFLVEGIIIFLLIAAASFFYQARLSSKVLKIYQSQSKKAAEAVNGLTAVVDVFKKNNAVLTARLVGFDQEKKGLIDENAALKEKSSSLEAQSKSLETQVNGLKEEKTKIQAEAESLRANAPSGINSESLAPVESKLKNVEAMLDSIGLSASDKKKIQNLLSSVYKELSAVDISIARISGQEPLYRDKFAAKEREMKSYSEKVKALGRENEDLAAQIKEAKSRLSGSKDRMRFLEEEQKQYQAQKDILAQNISQYGNIKTVSSGELDELSKRLKTAQEANRKLSTASKQKTQMEADLLRLTAELKDKEAKAKTLEAQSTGMALKYQEAQAKYDSTQKDIDKLKSEIGSRSNKVLSLQESLEAKNISLAQLTARVQDQIKEMSLLREKFVRTQIENARLYNSLKATDQAFSLLKEEMNSIGQSNVKVKEYLDQASSNLSAVATGNNSEASLAVSNKTESSPAASEQPKNPVQPLAVENKEVMVNISSVEPQNATPQDQAVVSAPVAPPPPAPAPDVSAGAPEQNNQK